MKLAIFGGAGQVGYHLARYFNSIPGFEAVALCRSAVVSAALRASNMPFRIYDSRSTESIHTALKGCDVVIDSTFAPMRSLRRTELSSLLHKSVMSAAGLRQVIHFSSVAVYGELSAGAGNFRRPKPDTLYGAQKLATERIVRKIGEQTGTPVLVARLGHVYGAEMAWSLDFISRLRKEQLPLEHFEKPSNAIHVSQICQAVRAVIEQRDQGCRDFIGSPNLSWREIFDWHSRALRAVDGKNPRYAARMYRRSSRRFESGRGAFLAEALRNVKSNFILGLTGSPRVAHMMRMFLASFPCAPSVESVKSTMGSPGLERYFSGVSGNESDFVFDSLQLTGPPLETSAPVSDDDLCALEMWLRSISEAGGVLEHLDRVLGANHQAVQCGLADHLQKSQADFELDNRSTTARSMGEILQLQAQS